MSKALLNTYPGGVVEQGSNADGEYIKYVDGLMVCWGIDTSSTADITITFPVAFVSVPTFEAFLSNTGNDNHLYSASAHPTGGITNTGANIAKRFTRSDGSSVDNATAEYVHWVARGYWE